MGGDAGSRSPESVFDQFRQYRREIQGALRAGLKSRPDSGATIAIRFVVGPAGDLRSLSLTTKGLGDVAIEEPIRAVFARMRFERIESGSVTTTLRYEVACD